MAGPYRIRLKEASVRHSVTAVTEYEEAIARLEHTAGDAWKSLIKKKIQQQKEALQALGVTSETISKHLRTEHEPTNHQVPYIPITDVVQAAATEVLPLRTSSSTISLEARAP
jgi:hypothetical protein